MYIETITDNLDIFRIERQKNTPKGEWYGIALSCDGKYLADNDTYIAELYYSLRDNPKRIMDELGLPHMDGNSKKIRKIIKKAHDLGWFENNSK
jgi:hypothetical protein